MDHIGRFEIQSELGRGGIGVVSLGYDPLLKRPVAVKSVLRELASEQQPWELMLKRLAAEAQAAAGLDHPNIVAVYDLVQTEDALYVIMEFVAGQSLAKAVPPGARATFAVTNWIVSQCASALDHAHLRHVIHRDIKPANIMLKATGGVKIADFGIAKIGNAGSSGLTLEGAGTLEFMSPEQLQAKPMDGRADQYSLAVVAHRLLTGRPRFAARSVPEWCGMILTGNPEPASAHNPKVDVKVDRVLARALARDAAERYPTCSEFARELGAALAAPQLRKPEQLTISAPAPTVKTAGLPANTPVVDFTPRFESFSHKVRWGWIAGLLVAAGLALAAAFHTSSPDRAAPYEARKSSRDGLSYVWIPPGTFLMGCSEGDKDCDSDERPRHPVTLTKGFWISQTEETQQGYYKVRQNNPSYFIGAKLPVDNVDWNEARAFCKAAGLRLPTEAEWEFAARGGSQDPQYVVPDLAGWFERNSAGRSHEARGKKPNPYGLYDTLGNVWEWVEDRYGLYIGAAVSDPAGPSAGDYRVLRGGSWNLSLAKVRVSVRLKVAAGGHGSWVGFRCAGDSLE